MSILINWTNPAQPADGIQIYRSTAPFDSSNLPAVLATLPANATEYEDATNLLNVVYYYRIARVVGSDIVLSKQLPLTERANMGPGGTTLIRGDYDTGYLGEVSADVLFTASALSTELSWSPGSVVTANPSWRKFIHDGKIKFIPSGPLRSNIGAWSAIYSQGLVYGSDDNGAYSSLTPTLQNRRVSKDGFTYKVRLIKAHGKASYSIPSSGPTKDSVPDSELAELITRLISHTMTNGTARWNNRPRLLNDAVPASSIIFMAGIYSTNCYSLHTSSIPYIQNISGVNSQASWLPVLELED